MFETVAIKGRKWLAEISPELGANVTKLQYENKDVFIPLLTKEQLAVNPYIQGAPLLFPANRTAGGRFSFEGCEYSLPITEEKTGANLHGLLHRECFDVVEAREDSITLFYKNENKIYPFQFEITVFYGFYGDKFIQRYNIKNTGCGNMPVTFALHTSFVEPEIFKVPIDACHTKDENHIPYGNYDSLNEQEQKYVTGSQSKGICISGYYRASGDTAVVGDFAYRVSPNFDHWILFNGEGKKGLLCVEPQCGKSNGLNTDDGKVILGVGQTLSLWTELWKTQKN